jgi:hypothetical protein
MPAGALVMLVLSASLRKPFNASNGSWRNRRESFNEGRFSRCRTPRQAAGYGSGRAVRIAGCTKLVLHRLAWAIRVRGAVFDMVEY